MRTLMEVTWMCEPCHDVYRAKFEPQAVEQLLKPRCIICGQPMGIQRVVTPENGKRTETFPDGMQAASPSFSGK